MGVSKLSISVITSYSIHYTKLYEVWGPLMVGGTYYVTTGGEWSWPVAIIGLIYSLGPTSVLFGKHIDKSKEDRKKKVYTLPVLLGERNSRISTIILWILQYGMVAWLIISGAAGYSLAIVLFAIPTFVKIAGVFRITSYNVCYTKLLRSLPRFHLCITIRKFS